MPSVCFDCKLYYGHPLYYCPGCAKSLGYLSYQQVKDMGVDYSSIKDKDGWKWESKKDLYEIYINGEFICKSECQTGTYGTSKGIYSVLREKYNLESTEFLYFDYDNLNRKIRPYIKKPKCEKEYIPDCVISYRLTGSDLPV